MEWVVYLGQKEGGGGETGGRGGRRKCRQNVIDKKRIKFKGETRYHFLK